MDIHIQHNIFMGQGVRCSRADWQDSKPFLMKSTHTVEGIADDNDSTRNARSAEFSVTFCVYITTLYMSISSERNQTMIACFIIQQLRVCSYGAFIQGASRLQGKTAGGDFLCHCDQKSSYEHVSWMIPCSLHVILPNAPDKYVVYIFTNLLNFIWQTDWTLAKPPPVSAR
jgi:hypothetical protein